MSDSSDGLPWRLHDSQDEDSGTAQDDEAGAADGATAGSPAAHRVATRAGRRKRAVSPETLARSRVQAARRRIVQALYAFQLSPTDRATLLADLRDDVEHAKVDDAYFERLLMRVLDHRSRHDAAIESVAGRAAAAIDPVERAVLWLAVEELESELAIPAAVVVSEALAIAGRFGAEHSHRFVHAVLEHLSRRLRPDETATRGALPRIEAPAEPRYPAGLTASGPSRLAAAIEGGVLPSADGRSQVRVRRRSASDATPARAEAPSAQRAPRPSPRRAASERSSRKPPRVTVRSARTRSGPDGGGRPTPPRAASSGAGASRPPRPRGTAVRDPAQGGARPRGSDANGSARREPDSGGDRKATTPSRPGSGRA